MDTPNETSLEELIWRFFKVEAKLSGPRRNRSPVIHQIIRSSYFVCHLCKRYCIPCYFFANIDGQSFKPKSS